MEEAKADGVYESYEGSPISEGKFQHNLWGIEDNELSGRWDWASSKSSSSKAWSA